jgi:SAM-dependent methyltransferase
MQHSTKAVLREHFQKLRPRCVLDAPCGDGWLVAALPSGTLVDGCDLYTTSPPGYRRFWQQDLDEGLPPDCGEYDLICCCEGIEHLGNPLRLLRDCRRRLVAGGRVIVTTPNVWYPQARLQYLWRGFFPSFPPLAGKVVPGTHMHITPWSFPQLYVFLRLAGFVESRLINEPLSQAKHWHERLFAIPSRLHARRRLRRATTEEERDFWRSAASTGAQLGRHLIVEAEAPAA